MSKYFRNLTEVQKCFSAFQANLHLLLSYIFLSKWLFWLLVSINGEHKRGRFSRTISLSLHSARHTSVASPRCARQKIISGDLEQKLFAHFLKRLANFQANFFCSKSAEIIFLLCNVGMENKLYEINFFDLCVKNWSLLSKFPSSKKVLWFFSKVLRFRIFLRLDYQTTNP